MVTLAVFSCGQAAWFYTKTLDALIEQIAQKEKIFISSEIHVYESENGYVVEIPRATLKALGYESEHKL